MEHFNIGQWIDFAREMAGSPLRDKLQEHLDAGCAACQEDLRFAMKLAAAAQGDRHSEPPESAVRLAEAIFRPSQSEEPSLWQRIVGHLVFNSLTDPLPAGARVLHSQSPQAIFEADGYVVDLLIDFEPDSVERTLVGGLTRRDSAAPAAGIPIQLLANKKALSRAVTNDHGEFWMVFSPARNLTLQITLGEEGKILEFSLKDLVKE